MTNITKLFQWQEGSIIDRLNMPKLGRKMIRTQKHIAIIHGCLESIKYFFGLS